MPQTTVVSPYADYEFYRDTYLGDALSADDFARMELRAEEQLDAMTFGRIKSMDEKFMTEELALNIRKAVCAMAEACKRSNPAYAHIPSGISSESNDGYSVSYGARSATEIQGDYKSVMKGLATQYLASSGLLYRGGGAWHDD